MKFQNILFSLADLVFRSAQLLKYILYKMNNNHLIISKDWFLLHKLCCQCQREANIQKCMHQIPFDTAFIFGKFECLVHFNVILNVKLPLFLHIITEKKWIKKLPNVFAQCVFLYKPYCIWLAKHKLPKCRNGM